MQVTIKDYTGLELLPQRLTTFVCDVEVHDKQRLIDHTVSARKALSSMPPHR